MQSLNSININPKPIIQFNNQSNISNDVQNVANNYSTSQSDIEPEDLAQIVKIMQKYNLKVKLNKKKKNLNNKKMKLKSKLYRNLKRYLKKS
jgi:hypothetical protein